MRDLRVEPFCRTVPTPSVSTNRPVDVSPSIFSPAYQGLLTRVAGLLAVCKPLVYAVFQGQPLSDAV